MKNWKRICTVVLAGFCSVSYASDWYDFRMINVDNFEYYFDASTVQKSGVFVDLWIKSISKSKPKGDDAFAITVRWRMNCANKTIQTLTSSLYDENGKFLKSNTVSSEPYLVAPDTIGEAWQQVACQSDFPKNTSGNSYFRIEGGDLFKATKNIVANMEAGKLSRIDSAPK